MVLLIFMKKSRRILVCVSCGRCLNVRLYNMIICTSPALLVIRSIDNLVSMWLNLSFLRIVLLSLLLLLLLLRLLIRLPLSFLYILESFLNWNLLLAVYNWCAISWREQISVTCGPWTHAWWEFIHALVAQARCRQSVWRFGRGNTARQPDIFIRYVCWKVSRLNGCESKSCHEGIKSWLQLFNDNLGL